MVLANPHSSSCTGLGELIPSPYIPIHIYTRLTHHSYITKRNITNMLYWEISFTNPLPETKKKQKDNIMDGFQN